MGSTSVAIPSRFCIVQNIKIAPIPNVTLDVGDSFNYEVNITNRNNATPVFSDDTALFSINSSTGVINYTAQQSDVGYHAVRVTVSVFNVCPGFSSDYSWSTSFSMNVTGNVTPPTPPRPRPGGGGSAGAGVRDAVVVQPVVPPPLPDEKPQPKQEFLEQRQAKEVSRPVGLPENIYRTLRDASELPMVVIRTKAINLPVLVFGILLVMAILTYIFIRSTHHKGKKASKKKHTKKNKKKRK